MSQYSALTKFLDPGQRQAVKLLMDRISTMETASASIGVVSAPLTTHLDSGGNQLKSVADPTAPTDAVTLSYMQKWVEGRIASLQSQIDALDARVTALEP